MHRIKAATSCGTAAVPASSGREDEASQDQADAPSAEPTDGKPVEVDGGAEASGSNTWAGGVAKSIKSASEGLSEGLKSAAARPLAKFLKRPVYRPYVVNILVQ